MIIITVIIITITDNINQYDGNLTTGRNQAFHSMTSCCYRTYLRAQVATDRLMLVVMMVVVMVVMMVVVMMMVVGRSCDFLIDLTVSSIITIRYIQC
jgi:hypothetical protein